MERTEGQSEIEEIERYVVARWVENGDALVCARCGGVYILSGSSDDRLCGSCYPARNIPFGDGSVRHPECERCGREIRGRRGDSKYCSDSCKTLMCRERKSGKAEAMQEGVLPAQEGEHIGERAIRKQVPLEGGSTT